MTGGFGLICSVDTKGAKGVEYNFAWLLDGKESTKTMDDTPDGTGHVTSLLTMAGGKSAKNVSDSNYAITRSTMPTDTN